MSQALILGASGLVGLHTTKYLLADNSFDKIYAVSRHGIPIQHERLIQIKADFDTIDIPIRDLQINHLFSCLGSTKSKTPNKEDYKKVDHDYPIKVARILKENGLHSASIVSALGANKDSITFYMRLKAMTEQSFEELGLDQLFIMQPSLIVGNRKEKRLAEKFASILFNIINPLLLGDYNKYRSIKGSVIARALVETTKLDGKGIFRFNTQEIKELT